MLSFVLLCCILMFQHRIKGKCCFVVNNRDIVQSITPQGVLRFLFIIRYTCNFSTLMHARPTTISPLRKQWVGLSFAMV